jgi:dynein heavy chain
VLLQAEYKSICFALAFFHAIIIERKKFGPQGWNRSYPFNTGDLLSSVMVANNYLESNPKIPWEDLRYIFGEIMYGGHITDDWDRKLCNTYLLEYFNEQLLEGMELFAGFAAAPSSNNTKAIAQYVVDYMPPETPTAFRLHPNAEIGFRLDQANSLFRNLRELQPRSAQTGSGITREQMVRDALQVIFENLPEPFNVADILDKVEERSPFTNVFLQVVAAGPIPSTSRL